MKTKKTRRKEEKEQVLEVKNITEGDGGFFTSTVSCTIYNGPGSQSRKKPVLQVCFNLCPCSLQESLLEHIPVLDTLHKYTSTCLSSSSNLKHQMCCLSWRVTLYLDAPACNLSGLVMSSDDSHLPTSPANVICQYL